MIMDLLIEEKKAKRIIEAAEKKAKILISDAKESAEAILREAALKVKVDQMTKDENVKTRNESEEITQECCKKKENLKNKAESNINQAVQYVIKEVLCVDSD